MRRHLIIGRFGNSDRADIPTADGEVSTRLEFVVSKSRLEHDIGSSLDDLSKIGVFPSEIGLDLLVLAAHVQAADTRISRSTESQDDWTREIRTRSSRERSCAMEHRDTAASASPQFPDGRPVDNRVQSRDRPDLRKRFATSRRN